MQYLPLVKRIVRQLSLQANQVLDREDMEQIGMIGLLEGLRRYGEPDEQFGRFAALRIRGAILDELRRRDWRPRQSGSRRTRCATRSASPPARPHAERREIKAFTGLDERITRPSSGPIRRRPSRASTSCCRAATSTFPMRPNCSRRLLGAFAGAGVEPAGRA